MLRRVRNCMQLSHANLSCHMYGIYVLEFLPLGSSIANLDEGLRKGPHSPYMSPSDGQGGCGVQQANNALGRILAGSIICYGRFKMLN